MRILIFVFLIAFLFLVGCSKDENGEVVIGTIVDTATSLPLSNAKITIGNITNVTNQDGTYRLDNVPSGDRTVIVQLAGYKTDSRNINVPENNVMTLDIRLERIGGAQPSGILTKEGPQEISIGIGSTPQILWTGGDVYQLTVTHWDINKENWVLIWAIQGKDIHFENGTGPGDIISSPITYGVIPSTAIASTKYMSFKLIWEDWVFETFETGEKYCIRINGRNTGISYLYFVR